MVTKDQAIAAGNRTGPSVFHYALACTPKRVENWRANGVCKTWVRSPDRFQLPIKFGLRSYDYLTELNADQFHLATDCPVSSPVIGTYK